MVHIFTINLTLGKINLIKDLINSKVPAKLFFDINDKNFINLKIFQLQTHFPMMKMF